MITRAQKIARQEAINKIMQEETKKEQEQLKALNASEKEKILVRKAIINNENGEVEVTTGTAANTTTTNFRAEDIFKAGAELKRNRQNIYLSINIIAKIARSYEPIDVALTAAFNQLPGGFYHDYFHGKQNF